MGEDEEGEDIQVVSSFQVYQPNFCNAFLISSMLVTFPRIPSSLI
jgi:hypothetical protein